MREETKQAHEKAVKGKSIREAQDYCRMNRIHNRWVEEDEPKEKNTVKRLNLVINGKGIVFDTYWG